MALCEFKVSLLYIVSPRTPGAIERPVSENKNKTKKFCPVCVHYFVKNKGRFRIKKAKIFVGSVFMAKFFDHRLYEHAFKITIQIELNFL